MEKVASKREGRKFSKKIEQMFDYFLLWAKNSIKSLHIVFRLEKNL